RGPDTQKPAGLSASHRLRAINIAGEQSRYTLTFWTFVACSPLGPLTISNSTSSPSVRVLKPAPWIAEKWTKMSLPPSRAINPYPLRSSNHLTEPLGMHFLRTYAQGKTQREPVVRHHRSDFKPQKEGRGSLTMLGILIIIPVSQHQLSYTAERNISKGLGAVKQKN